MLPAWTHPSRSVSFGRRLKTLGQYPLVVGGSPAARPISRCAWAKRVSESIMNNTSLPWSRKYSATVMAVNATLTRWMGEVSEVATATTLRLSPSAPNDSSRNWRTSRPRSPTSASTLTSASEVRAISPNSVLLPTPLPEKMPILWPLPQVSSPSKLRMPNTNGSVMRFRLSGGGGGLSSDRRSTEAPSRGPPDLPGSAHSGPLPSIGLPSPSITRPRMPAPRAM